MGGSDLYTFVFLATLAPMLSGLILLYCFQSTHGRIIRWMLALSAGLLIGIATLDLIPEAMELAEISRQQLDASDIEQELAAMRQIPVEDPLEGEDEDQPYFAPKSKTSPHLSLRWNVWKQLSRQIQTFFHEHVDANEEEYHLEPHSHQDFDTTFIMIGIFVGYMVLLSLEKFFMGNHSHSHSRKDDHEMASGHHHQEHKHEEVGISSTFSYTVFLAFAVHSFADGFLIAGGYESSDGLGARVALAVVSHKFPDGFVLASVIGARGNLNRKTGLLLLAGVSLMTPIGATIGSLILGNVSARALGFILAYGAGNFFYIAFTAIIPELMEDRRHYFSTVICIFAGYASFLFSSLVFGHGH
eukprot:TRINITY_DN4359_c0_g1_i1.p1 TRINITY_DN4359_c0_g1~~TRINITY_DN4359_c0_g1_i1.p1  ORF type:complete len:358 (-),score=76.91 TRINITY_DN4359_c0_g1_i1:116-1189(-)